MKNVNPWKLAALLGGLVVIFVSLKLFRSPGLESNLPTSLAEFDSAYVTELVITPAKAPGEEIHLVRAGNWKLVKDNKTLRLEQGSGVNALRMLMGLKPERIVSKKKEKWDEYGVGDSTGTRLRVMVGNSAKAELVIGKSAYNQMAGQQFGTSSFTFVRIFDEPEVYTVNGFLDAQFNRKTDDWRDKSLVRIKKDSIERISFRYPSDSSFVIERLQGRWVIGNQLADSVAVIAYIRGMEYKNGSAFTDSAPVGEPTAAITFEKGTRVFATLEGWPTVAGTWILRSSLQPETFFITDSFTMLDLFRGMTRFKGRS